MGFGKIFFDNLIVTNGTFHFDTVNLAKIQIFVEDIRLDFLEKRISSSFVGNT